MKILPDPLLCPPPGLLQEPSTHFPPQGTNSTIVFNMFQFPEGWSQPLKQLTVKNSSWFCCCLCFLWLQGLDSLDKYLLKLSKIRIWQVVESRTSVTQWMMLQMTTWETGVVQTQFDVKGLASQQPGEGNWWLWRLFPNPSHIRVLADVSIKAWHCLGKGSQPHLDCSGFRELLCFSDISTWQGSASVGWMPSPALMTQVSASHVELSQPAVFGQNHVLWFR